MAVKQYIGARYVPKFYVNSQGTADWTPNTQYEPLTIVTRNGNSYTSKKEVSADIGTPEDNPTYWVSTGIYNEQIEAYRQAVAEVAQEVEAVDTRIDEAEEAITAETNNRELADRELKEELLTNLQGEVSNREEADTALNNKIEAINKYVNAELLYNVTPENTTAQGFATDGMFGYMAYYAEGESCRLIKFNMSSGVIVKEVDLGEQIHGNNITIYNNNLYLTKAGGSSSEVYVFDNNLVKIKTLSFGSNTIHSFGYIPYASTSPVYDKIALALPSSLRNVCTLWIDENSNKTFTVQKSPLQYSNTVGYRNAFHVSETSFLTSASYRDLDGVVYPCTIDLYDFKINKLHTIIINNLEEELEDISRVSGDNYTYFNTIDGNVYKINTVNLLGESSANNVFWDKKTLSSAWCAFAYDIVMENKLVTQFKLSIPNDVQMSGMTYTPPAWGVDGINSNYVSINPASRSITITGTAQRSTGSGLNIFRLTYGLKANTGNEYELNLNASSIYQIAPNGTITLYNDILNSNPFNTDMQISNSPIVYLPTSFFGWSGSIS